VGQLQAQTFLDERRKGFAAASRLPTCLVQQSVIEAYGSPHMSRHIIMYVCMSICTLHSNMVISIK
jgi:hypothetical protein